MKKTLALCMWLLVACVPGLPQRKTNPAIARPEKDIPLLMKRSDVVGLSVALIRNGKLAWSRRGGRGGTAVIPAP